MLLPDTLLGEAVEVAGAIRPRRRLPPWRFRGGCLRITYPTSASAAPSTKPEDDNLASWYAGPAEAMYQASWRGRNWVMTAVR